MRPSYRKRLHLQAINGHSIRLLAILAMLGACSEGPESSVRSLGKAFHDEDRLRVTRYMDVDRSAASVTTALMAEVTRQAGRDSSEPGSELGGMLGTAMIGAMQPAMTAYFRQIIYYMADPSTPMPTFMGKADASAQPSRAVLRDSLGSGVQVRPGRIEGDVALVPVFFPATASRTDSGTVELRLERAGKNWKVVGVERFPEAIFASVKARMP